MNLNVNTPTSSPSFRGFAKFKCDRSEAKQLKRGVKDCLPNCYILWDGKIKNKNTYFILTGKHKDKFLKHFGEMSIMKLKENIEKIFREKAKKIKLDDLKKGLRKGNLSI